MCLQDLQTQQEIPKKFRWYRIFSLPKLTSATSNERGVGLSEGSQVFLYVAHCISWSHKWESLGTAIVKDACKVVAFYSDAVAKTKNFVNSVITAK